MTYKVNEVSNLTGVTARMLHHYHKIGLLVPESISESGYRLYSKENLERLQQILFLKELDFSLKEICSILDNPNYDTQKALSYHKELLLKKQSRLNKIIQTLDTTLSNLKGGTEMNTKEMFTAFDLSEIEAHKAKYAKEVEEKWGGNEAYEEYLQKTKDYKTLDWAKATEEMNDHFKSLAKIIDLSPEDKKVQEIIHSYRECITKNFYNCTLEIFDGLGEMYVADPRFTKNIDKHGEGLSVFIRDAIKVYCTLADK